VLDFESAGLQHFKKKLAGPIGIFQASGFCSAIASCAPTIAFELCGGRYVAV